MEVTYTGIQGQILDFLGQGLSAAVVASAVGVSESYVSQLLSKEDFRGQVRARRIATLQRSADLDAEYDDLEAKLQTKLKRILPLIIKPRDVLDAIKVVNSAKRRGTQDMASDAQVSQVIEVRMPTNILQQFIKVEHNSLNQIVQAGPQSLVTAQPAQVQQLANLKELENDPGEEKQRRVPSLSSCTEPGSTRELSLENLD